MAALTKPIDHYSLASLLGTTKDTVALCTATSINKWSKNKPVDVNATSELTDDQRKGVPSTTGVPAAYNNNAGYYYGLKLATSTASADWLNIHSLVTYAYHRPSGGINSSPYRDFDFVGYEHTQGNPCDVALSGGTLEAYSDIEQGLDVRLVHSGNAATEPSDAKGIDAAWCCASSKASVFPVVVMSRNGSHWACALSLDADNKSHPLWYNNARQDAYHIDFRGLPSLATNVEYKMSIGVCTTGTLNVYSGAVPQWQAISSTGFSQRFFGLASGINRTIKLVPSDNTPDVSSVSVAQLLGSRLSLDYGLSRYDFTSGTYYVRVWASIQDSSQRQRGAGYGVPVVAKTSATGGISPQIDLSTILEDRPASSTTFTVLAQVEIGTGSTASTFVKKKASSTVTLSWTYNP